MVQRVHTVFSPTDFSQHLPSCFCSSCRSTRSSCISQSLSSTPASSRSTSLPFRACLDDLIDAVLSSERFADALEHAVLLAVEERDSFDDEVSEPSEGVSQLFSNDEEASDEEPRGATDDGTQE